MSTSDKICSDGASKSNDDVCEINDKLHNMSTDDNKGVSICANCDKEDSSDNMNTCNKCMMVKYCNAACKKKHRSKHKKQCERRVAELHDIELFKQPPPQHGDCPICFIRLPTRKSGYRYMTCCGKEICSGCLYAPLYDNQGNEVDNKKCPFCRVPTPTSKEEMLEREKKRMEAGDAIAIYNVGIYYADGLIGPRNYTKALELWHRSGELGYAAAYTNTGFVYQRGRGVERDEKKAVYYCELAAIRGCNIARYNLGIEEENAGNMERALKHHMIAVKDGDNDSLTQIQLFYSNGQASKEDYTNALQFYQAYLSEIKSRQRDEAAVADEDYRYY